MKKAVKILNKALDWISLAFFAWIFVFVIFFADSMEYACKRVLNMNNKELLLIGFAICYNIFFETGWNPRILYYSGSQNFACRRQC